MFISKMITTHATFFPADCSVTQTHAISGRC